MDYLKEEEVKLIEDMAYEIRRLSIEMISNSQWGHIGGSLSLAEILSVLYFKVLRVNMEQPKSEDRDYFILSKAHSSPALYSALTLKGFITIDRLYTYCRIGGLDGHLDMLNTPELEVSGGSLGLGLSYSVGIAYALQLKEKFHHRVYCVIGDGELSEGQIWEAAMSASHYKLYNLIIIIDYNKIMAKGFVSNEMSQEPLTDRWRSFGWNVIEVDGHDVKEFYQSFYRAKYIGVNGKPTCIIAHTVKGRGIEECEFNYKWHTHAPSVEETKVFLKELATRYNKPLKEFKMCNDSPKGTLMSVIGGEK